ncbi:MAG TPA: hypothetical protein VFF06_34320 [Polyangia bacterium]|nr:hypothetical protein [Polyangia bacterium]
MRAIALVLIGVLIGAAAVAVWNRSLHIADEARIARLERSRDEARSQCNAPLLARIGAATALLRSGRNAKPPSIVQSATPSLPSPSASDGGNEEASDDNPADVVLNWNLGASRLVDDLRRRANLTEEQQTTLRSASADMNRELSEAIDRFKALDESKATSRDAIDIALDALKAIKRADDTFRSGLSPQQRESLDRERFDVLSQLDPMLLLKLSQPTTL